VAHPSPLSDNTLSSNAHLIERARDAFGVALSFPALKDGDCRVSGSKYRLPMKAQERCSQAHAGRPPAADRRVRYDRRVTGPASAERRAYSSSE
jgi:hypothetical protein